MIIIGLIAIIIVVLVICVMLNPSLQDKMFGKIIEKRAERVKKGFMNAEKNNSNNKEEEDHR